MKAVLAVQLLQHLQDAQHPQQQHSYVAPGDPA
jgi:hypothetical protein